MSNLPPILQAEARLRASLDRAVGTDAPCDPGTIRISSPQAHGRIALTSDRAFVSLDLELGTADLLCQVLALRERGVAVEEIVLGHCVPEREGGGFRRLDDILEEVLVEIRPAPETEG